MADQVRDLHAAIMNLPCNVPPMVVDDQAYKLGHRDARHAAAGLAASHAADVEALRSALRRAGDFIESVHEGEWPPHAYTRDELVDEIDAALKGDKP